ncbi:collagen-like protein [Pseudosporangium ferrugineum]|uniref:Collagen triple helix repeat protein n=1 Tax=Pseudosporangium ferrugineum TaxID=439699 RepID=A0A2T0SD42_9ACTN|nr:collagen-like protein [Pseudosporangium ferrugineum]PRY31326.1 collagen triple helix repeat protein [Pseudosporangium ferrugineum]
MDHKVWMYLVYLAISVGLTVWVATTLSRNGLVFLEDVFADNRLARAVNHLLVMGFYLLNLGYVAVAMRSGARIPDAARALETLSYKIGFVLLVLGLLHVLNVFFLGRYRRGRLRLHQGMPPLPPAGRLPMMPPGPQGPTGPLGATGPHGATGSQGAAGPHAATGSQGAAGPHAATGSQGAAGPHAATGPHVAAGGGAPGWPGQGMPEVAPPAGAPGAGPSSGRA